jgi:hypothetical protein
MIKIKYISSLRSMWPVRNFVVTQGDCAFLRKDRSAGSASKEGVRLLLFIMMISKLNTNPQILLPQFLKGTKRLFLS